MSVAPGPYSWQPAPAPSRRENHSRRTENIVLTLIVVAALIPALWFGLQPGTAGSTIPQQPPGTSYDAFPLRVSFGSAKVVDEAPPAAYKQEGKRYFLVEMTATVIADRYLPITNAQSMVSMSTPGLLWINRPATEPVAPTFYRAPGGRPLLELAPGVETLVLLVWEQSSDAPVPPTITIQIIGLEWVESTLEDGWVWRTDDPVAQTTLTVGQG